MCLTTTFTPGLLMRTRAVPTNVRDAHELFDQMVNGHLLAVMHPHVYSEELAVTISTISALMKEFNIDWVSEDLVAKDLTTQKAALRQLGFYCQLPVKQLMTLLRKRIRCGFAHPAYSLSSLINGFMETYCPSESRMLLLSSYLFTAINAVRMTHPNFSIPFEIEITSRGKVFLAYSYRAGVHARRHVKRYPLNCRFANGVGAASPGMRELFNRLSFDASR